MCEASEKDLGRMPPLTGEMPEADCPAALTVYVDSYSGVTWQVEAIVCPTLTCGCPFVHLFLRAEGMQPRYLSLDPQRATYFESDEYKHVGQYSGAFARNFVADWKAADWETLDAWQAATKSELIRFAAIQSDQLVLTPEALNHRAEGLMLGYGQLFPRYLGEPVVIDEQLYFLEDRYCLRDGCSCGSGVVLLQQLRYADAGGSDTGDCRDIGIVVLAECEVETVGRRIGKYKSVGALGGSSAKRTAADVLRQVIKSCDKKKFQERQRHLQALFASAEDRYRSKIGVGTGRQDTVRRETPKTGRNDPCPCGSGRKYKKCCGS